MARLTVVADEEAVAARAAERITFLIAQSIEQQDSAVVCLTGGKTPQRLYERLVAAPIDWTRVHCFWGDERHVPPDHPDSNFGMAHRALLAHVPVPAGQVHRMPAERPDASEAARVYEATLRDGFARAGRTDQTVDVMLLGLGEDAHIASIFPGSPLLPSRAGLQGPPRGPQPFDKLRVAPSNVEGQGSAPHVAAVFAAHLNAWRITLTPAALLDARAILMIVSGATKADAVHAAFEMPEDVARWPVQLLRAAGDRVEWVTDEDAGRRLADR